jgi:hypothetical protein
MARYYAVRAGTLTVAVQGTISLDFYGMNNYGPTHVAAQLTTGPKPAVEFRHGVQISDSRPSSSFYGAVITPPLSAGSGLVGTARWFGAQLTGSPVQGSIMVQTAVIRPDGTIRSKSNLFSAANIQQFASGITVFGPSQAVLINLPVTGLGAWQTADMLLIAFGVGTGSNNYDLAGMGWQASSGGNGDLTGGGQQTTYDAWADLNVTELPGAGSSARPLSTRGLSQAGAANAPTGKAFSYSYGSVQSPGVSFPHKSHLPLAQRGTASAFSPAAKIGAGNYENPSAGKSAPRNPTFNPDAATVYGLAIIPADSIPPGISAVTSPGAITRTQALQFTLTDEREIANVSCWVTYGSAPDREWVYAGGQFSSLYAIGSDLTGSSTLKTLTVQRNTPGFLDSPTIFVEVTDTGGNVTTQSFAYTVSGYPNAPVITAITAPGLLPTRDTAVSFTVADDTGALSIAVNVQYTNTLLRENIYNNSTFSAGFSVDSSVSGPATLKTFVVDRRSPTGWLDAFTLQIQATDIDGNVISNTSFSYTIPGSILTVDTYMNSALDTSTGKYVQWQTFDVPDPLGAYFPSGQSYYTLNCTNYSILTGQD